MSIALSRPARAILIATLTSVAAFTVASCHLHSIGAGALLFPSKHVTRAQPPAGCVEKQFPAEGITLTGWHCASQTQPQQGVVVYLHGIADNRGGSAGVATRFTSRGFEFIAYDSRAHGASGGEHCTYGFYEKRDLRAVLDAVGAHRVILIGHSLGAAVALQTAAIEPRVSAVVAASSFSDLRTIATERAPFIFTRRSIAGALARAEQDGRFRADEVSPLHAASAITAPVLLIHGEADHNTAPAHSSRIFEALRGPKQLLLVPAAGHNDVLNGDVWRQIERWIAAALSLPV